MTLRNRLGRLESNRPALGADAPLDLVGLAPDLVARVMQAKADGTFPQSFSDADLQTLVDLTANAGGAS